MRGRRSGAGLRGTRSRSASWKTRFCSRCGTRRCSMRWREAREGAPAAQTPSDRGRCSSKVLPERARPPRAEQSQSELRFRWCTSRSRRSCPSFTARASATLPRFCAWRTRSRTGASSSWTRLTRWPRSAARTCTKRRDACSPCSSATWTGSTPKSDPSSSPPPTVLRIWTLLCGQGSSRASSSASRTPLRAQPSWRCTRSTWGAANTNSSRQQPRASRDETFATCVPPPRDAGPRTSFAAAQAATARLRASRP
mmetsp:Transcript_27339/g.89487  ORF Transcript_27339/g.89487 Transcript_27339/m.89487 type:complete len:254 (-) Transcript_27339:316-1077(-)